MCDPLLWWQWRECGLAGLPQRPACRCRSTEGKAGAVSRNEPNGGGEGQHRRVSLPASGSTPTTAMSGARCLAAAGGTLPVLRGMLPSSPPTCGNQCRGKWGTRRSHYGNNPISNQHTGIPHTPPLVQDHDFFKKKRRPPTHPSQGYPLPPRAPGGGGSGGPLFGG